MIGPQTIPQRVYPPLGVREMFWIILKITFTKSAYKTTWYALSILLVLWLFSRFYFQPGFMYIESILLVYTVCISHRFFFNITMNLSEANNHELAMRFLYFKRSFDQSLSHWLQYKIQSSKSRAGYLDISLIWNQIIFDGTNFVISRH